jgi:hypothetical protein
MVCGFCGRARCGREELLSRKGTLPYIGRFRNSVQRERLEELTFVGTDAAVVRFYSTLTGDERAPDKLIRSRKILIVTKREGAWKVGWGQNTRLADTTPN